MRRIKGGTSAVLLQSGLDEKWWADYVECHCCLADGKTVYEKAMWRTISRTSDPFGSMVEYHTISAEDQSRLHLFGKKVLPGIFLGYVLIAAGI